MHHYINRYTKFAAWQIWRVGGVVWGFKDNGQIWIVGNNYIITHKGIKKFSN